MKSLKKVKLNQLTPNEVKAVKGGSGEKGLNAVNVSKI